jgi:hypothetical protein
MTDAPDKRFWDRRGQCWREEDEPVTAPSLPAPLADDFSFRLGPPLDGFVSMAFTGAEQSALLEADDVCDPFPDIVTWLERLACGGLPRLWIEIGPTDAELFVADPHEDTVRFFIDYSDIDSVVRTLIDVRVKRLTLVRIIWAELREAWPRMRVSPHWGDRWLEPQAPPSPPLVSPTLDAVLGTLAP